MSESGPVHCLRADVSYFLCCTRKREFSACNKGNRRRLHAGNPVHNSAIKFPSEVCLTNKARNRGNFGQFYRYKYKV